MAEDTTEGTCTEHADYLRLFRTDRDRLPEVFTQLHNSDDLAKFCMIHHLQDTLHTAVLDLNHSAKTQIKAFFASGLATTIQKFAEDPRTYTTALTDPLPGVSTSIFRKYCAHRHCVEISVQFIVCSLRLHRCNSINVRPDP